MRSDRALDALNFFLADVRDGLGPYLSIYLLTAQHWDQASIGLVGSLAAGAGIAAQTPAGALVDASRAKRGLIAGAAVVVTLGCLCIPFLPCFWPIAVSQALTGVAAAIFVPAIAAMSRGMVGSRAFTARIGRNESFNHAGNAAAALLAGGSAYVWGPIVVFFLMALMAVASLVTVLAIPADAIGHDRARGLDDGVSHAAHHPPSGLAMLLASRPLMIFAASAVLFHFANAAMLPLVGQKLALANAARGTALTAACIVAAQVIMVPMAMLVGAKADDWGRKPLYLAAFLILPVRGCLYTLSDSPFWLVGVQLLDGIGAGLFGALLPLVVSDLTRGSGRFNIAQGAIVTAQGIGAALSSAVTGFVVVGAGYSAAFLLLAGIAGIGALLVAFAMQETSDGANEAFAPSPSAALKPAE